MKVICIDFPETLIFELKIFGVDSGFFFQDLNARTLVQTTGLNRTFVQDSHSRYVKNVLHGLHYQIGQLQGKLVRSIYGEVLYVAVNIRRLLRNFTKWIGRHLSANSKSQFRVLGGLAHCFCGASDDTEFLWKNMDYYAAEHERSILWFGLPFGIRWLLGQEPVLVIKYSKGQPFADIEAFN
jgi:dTDP-4-dehydrorhamnose 3,5-epimerase